MLNPEINLLKFAIPQTLSKERLEWFYLYNCLQKQLDFTVQLFHEFCSCVKLISVRKECEKVAGAYAQDYMRYEITNKGQR